MTRAAAGALAGAAALGLGLQALANHAAGGWPGVAEMLRFFTILTNVALAVLLARLAITGRGGAGTLGFLLVQIAVVGLVYHGVLARTHHPAGPAWWANLLLHGATPLGMLALWAWAGRRPLSWWRAAQWLLWPLGYCLGALAGGALSGWYPYFFLDPAVLGPGGVALAVLALALLFLLLGLAVVAAGRATRRTG